MNLSYQLLDGKKTAHDIQLELTKEVEQLLAAGHRAPHLVAILVGHDGGSETYVASKIKMCESIGYKSTLIRYEDSVTEDVLIQEIHRLNQDETVDGFIVQLPLPKHINEQNIIEAVSPAKDVDGFHPINVGRLSIDMPGFVSATPFGIIELLRRYNISTQGKHCVILGRSNIVGKPIASLLLHKGSFGDATVTICHRHTKNLKEITRTADILIAAMGTPLFVTEDMVTEGAVVIDVGTTRVPDSSRKSGYKLCGDVDFERVAPHTSFITPVPGGIGPMTIISLMYNTMQAAKTRIKKTK